MGVSTMWVLDFELWSSARATGALVIFVLRTAARYYVAQAGGSVLLDSSSSSVSRIGLCTAPG